jgi:hypothetical protein
LALKPGVTDLSRGGRKLIDGDLNVNDEGSTLMKKAPINNYTTTLMVRNMCAHELASPRRRIPASTTKNTSKNRKEHN